MCESFRYRFSFPRLPVNSNRVTINFEHCSRFVYDYSDGWLVACSNSDEANLIVKHPFSTSLSWCLPKGIVHNTKCDPESGLDLPSTWILDKDHLSTQWFTRGNFIRSFDQPLGLISTTRRGTLV